MKRWRAKQYRLKLSPRRTLQITVRRFRVSATRRSKKQSQLTIPLRIASIKEIACQIQVRKTRHRTLHKPAFWQWQASLPLVLIGMGIIGVSFFGAQLITAKSLQPVKTFAVAAPAAKHNVHTPKTYPYSPPVHVSIPRVGIDLDIIQVGLDSEGSIELPPLFAWEAGWYTGSPSPGQLGPAIIVGHVDTYKGISVFWRLRDAQSGDQIIITRADGKVLTFTVNGLAQYDQNNFPTDTVYGNLPYAGLKLITCGGTFDEQTHSYTQNTVVSATLAS